MNNIKEHLHNYVTKKDNTNSFRNTEYEQEVIDFRERDDQNDQGLHELAEDIAGKIQALDFTVMNLMANQIQATYENYSEHLYHDGTSRSSQTSASQSQGS